jgi:hypothetical protein
MWPQKILIVNYVCQIYNLEEIWSVMIELSTRGEIVCYCALLCCHHLSAHLLLLHSRTQCQDPVVEPLALKWVSPPWVDKSKLAQDC